MANQTNMHVDGIERALLGLFLRDIQIFFNFKDRIRQELFYNGRHQRIVKNMHILADGGAASFEFSLIAGRMGNDPGFDAGGYLYLLNEEAANPADAFELLVELEELLAKRKLLDLSKLAQEAATADNDKSFQERYADILKKMDQIGDRIGTQAIHVGRVGERMMDRIYDNFRNGAPVGMRSGLAALDNLMGPAMPGRVITLAGPPGSGKSSLGWQMACAYGKTAPGCFFSQEMEDEELTVRQMAMLTEIPGYKIEQASLNAEEVGRIEDASATLKDLRIHIDGESGLNHTQIRHRVHRLKRTVGCDWIVIDHLLYCGPTERRQSMLDRIEQNTKGLKFLAKSLKIPVIILAQLTKEYGKGTWKDVRAPQVGDIYGGAAVEHDSDVICFVHRPSVLLERREPPAANADEHGNWLAECLKWKGKAEISLGKRRGGIGYGSQVCHFHGPTFNFTDQPRRDPDAIPETFL